MDKFDLTLDTNNNTFTSQGGQAYTEDGVLVYTLHVSLVQYNYSKKVYKHFSPKLCEISAYFEKYGPVVNVRLESVTNHGYVYPYALVTFKQAEDACRVLEAALARGRAAYVGLSPANSSKQPFCEEMMRRRQETYQGPVNAEESPIFGLNDDCLMHLYTYLDLSDAFKVSKLCERFEKTFEHTFKKLYTEIDIKRFNSMTFLEWRQILKQYGQCFQRLEFSGHAFNMSDSIEEVRFMENVRIFCRNLKTFSLTRGLYFICSHNIDSDLQSVHSIELSKIDDDIMLLLSRMECIESLTLLGAEVTGLHLNDFQRLKHLKIDCCSHLNPLLLIKVFENVPTLTKLEIDHRDKIPDEVILKMSEFSGNLRELKISGCWGNIDPLVRLPNLEYLCISILSEMSGIFLLKLAANLKHKLRGLSLDLNGESLTVFQTECICQLTALEELTLSSMRVDDTFLAQLSSLKNLKCFETELCCPVKISAVVDFIRNAPKLEKLIFRNGPTDTTAQFKRTLLLSIIDLLRTDRREMKPPFHLYLNYYEGELNDIVSAHKDLIKVKSRIYTKSNFNVNLTERTLLAVITIVFVILAVYFKPFSLNQ